GEGVGPDWGDAPPAGRGEELRLVKDDVPVSGRVLGLEGQPIAGATVSVRRVDRTADGDLTAWIAARKDGRSVATKGFAPAPLGVPATLTTDRDGRFRMTGVGRERVLSLHLSSPGLATAQFWVLTRTRGVEGLQAGYFGTHGATFDFLARPSKPVVGSVRDRRTGKPLAGITGRSHRWATLSTRTGARGRYRLDGVSKGDHYILSAGGLPYFHTTKPRVADTAGLAPLTVDFELDRGIVVRGRLLDSEGQPVRGHVGYVATPDNPHRKDFPDCDHPQADASGYGHTGADGSFEVLAIPGPGVLTATVEDANRYTRSAPRRLTLGDFILDVYHALVPINVPEKGPADAHDIILERARSVSGTVTG